MNGAEGPKSDVLDFTLDTKVPAVSIDDLGETNNSKPVISGQTNEPKSEIDVVIKDQNGNVIDSGKGAVDANGNWTYMPKNPLPEGEYGVEVKAKDSAGNESVASGSGLVVDTTKPAVSIDPLKPTNDDTPAIQGAAEKGAAVKVEIKDAGGNTVESGNEQWMETATGHIRPKHRLQTALILWRPLPLMRRAIALLQQMQI